MSEIYNMNDNITPSEAKTILETVTWLCRNCALTHLEAAKIAKVCQDCLERLEQEQLLRSGNCEKFENFCKQC